MEFADLFLHFEDKQQWLIDVLTGMTAQQYGSFVDYCFHQLDDHADAKDGAEFCGVQGLLVAIARKEMEIAFFMDGVTEETRAAHSKAAEAYFQLARGFYVEDDLPALGKAWQASREEGERFGYPSVVAEILAPHHVFRTTVPEGPRSGAHPIKRARRPRSY